MAGNNMGTATDKTAAKNKWDYGVCTRNIIDVQCIFGKEILIW
jgi:hypothetical protein